MGELYVKRELYELCINKPLPVNIYLQISSKFVCYKTKGDLIDAKTFQKLELQKINNIFIHENDLRIFLKWHLDSLIDVQEEEEEETTKEPPELSNAKIESQRAMLDIFQAQHPDKAIAQAIKTSQKLILEIMKLPFTTKALNLLQTYSKGSVDHSVNVSVLSVYLALQMGYANATVLQTIGTGSLLHDIGKSKVNVFDNDTQEVIDLKLKEHPLLGLNLLQEEKTISSEIKSIVIQHHEAYDGSGYPNHLRGNSIHELTRLISIANYFDNAIAKTQGSLLERQKKSISKLDREYYKLFDPLKLDKVLKILKLGI
ncbi:MAG: HD domain-containing protein [Deltaproteobacteria bacterium]|nr:HD domain-containing protein [Deltaproteobacteria bacterium]